MPGKRKPNMDSGALKKQKCADTSSSVRPKVDPDCRQNVAPERRCACWDDMPWAPHCQDCERGRA